MTDSIATLRQALQQLQQTHASGALDAVQYEARKLALEQQLIAAVMAATPNPPPAEAPRNAASAPRVGVRLGAGAAALVVLVGGLGYAWTGSPALWGRSTPATAAPSASPDAAPATAEFTREQVEAMVARLAARMQEQPDDPTGWAMLGRSYAALGQAAEALAAYERALKLKPDDASTLADYADASAVQNGGTLEGAPLKLVERALKADPNHVKALVLAGTAAFNREDYRGAVSYWERAVKIGPADSGLVEMARGGITEARERGKLAPTALASADQPVASPGAPAAAPAPIATDASAIRGRVSLAPALQGRVQPNDTVFVFARPATGSRMPLAILRLQVKDLPASFTLDDSSAMSPAARLSAAGTVVVGARISKSGQALPQAGDLEGLTGPVPVGSAAVNLVIASDVK